MNFTKGQITIKIYLNIKFTRIKNYELNTQQKYRQNK